jgi:hypothetical protein
MIAPPETQGSAEPTSEYVTLKAVCAVTVKFPFHALGVTPET